MIDGLLQNFFEIREQLRSPCCTKEKKLLKRCCATMLRSACPAAIAGAAAFCHGDPASAQQVTLRHGIACAVPRGQTHKACRALVLLNASWSPCIWDQQQLPWTSRAQAENKKPGLRSEDKQGLIGLQPST